MKKNLRETHPELVKEWHPTKNGDLTPEDVTKGMMKKVWWLGKCGHEWETSITIRTHSTSPAGCPFCAGLRRLEEGYSLEKMFPELIKEWHFDKNGDLNPKEVADNSNKKIWWRCEKGHEWQATIKNRAYNKSGCPYCANKKILVGYNDFATTHPELAVYWNFEKNGDLKPTNVFAGSDKKVWWKCEKGHEWEQSLKDRKKCKSGCPVCSKKHLVTPELFEDWNYEKNENLKPEKITSAETRVWWKCKNGHECFDSVRKRIDFGCPGCKNKHTHKLVVGFNDLATTHPELAEEWDFEKNDILPTQISAGARKKVWWKCKKCGHGWEAVVSSRKAGRDCPKCQYDKAAETVTNRRLSQMGPELVSEWHPTLNKDLSAGQAGNNAIVWWQCKNGHAFKESILNRKKGYNCPCCDEKRSRKLAIGFNDLETMHPEIAAEWDFEKNKLLPSQVTEKSGKEVWWKCKHGHGWKSTVVYRITNHKDCPECRRREKWLAKKNKKEDRRMAIRSSFEN